MPVKPIQTAVRRAAMTRPTCPGSRHISQSVSATACITVTIISERPARRSGSALAISNVAPR